MIVCDEKLVRVPYGDETLIFHRDESNDGRESWLTFISCSKAQEYMAKGCQIFLAQISAKKEEDKLEGKQLKDVPGAAPVARAPYRLAPFGMKDLSEQLKELSDKGFIRTSFLTLGTFSPIFQKEGWIVQDVHRLPGIKQTNGHAIWTDQCTCSIHGPHEPGLVGYYRRFIEGFSKIAKSMTKLTQKGVKFDWGENEENAFQLIKQKLCGAPILALPEGCKDFVVYCDASHKGLGVVLMQREKVSAYASQQLKVHEKNYTTHNLKLGSVVFVLNIWRHYLYGTKCTVFTDHKSLQYILDQKELNMRQRHWLKLLSDYACDIRYHPGKTNVVVDALSRNVGCKLIYQSNSMNELSYSTTVPGVSRINYKGVGTMSIRELNAVDIKLLLAPVSNKIDAWWLFKRNIPVTILESRSLDAFPFFSTFPTAYTHHCEFTFPSSLFFNFGTSAVAGKVPYLVALVAFLSTRAIVMKMALGALGQVSPIWFPFTRSHIVDLGDILPLGGLLLITMVVSK
nr:putative reverse transcriptase domain-containing protein [Tanacetum cinerariifolium]